MKERIEGIQCSPSAELCTVAQKFDYKVIRKCQAVPHASKETQPSARPDGASVLKKTIDRRGPDI